ncbi:hypothetical protein [Carboxylicivirga taeanensis]|uniref:hypothetical protein n=1 Tax=Carboxylicivirga taeanensis TaxID=1416875 RepID=UPI003F6E144D
MKKFNYLSIVFILLLLFVACEKEISDVQQPYQAELKAGNADKTKLTGFDEWGFNYTARLFDGYLINAMFGDPAFMYMPHYKDMVYKGEGVSFWEALVAKYPYFVNMMPAGLLDCKLMMKWNDALLSKEAVYPDTWVDSGAWIVFHYQMDDGEQKWTQVRTLVASKSTDILDGDFWYNADGDEIGKKSYYWPELIIVKVINNGDNPYIPFAMPDDYLSPNGAGVGNY